MKKKKTTPDDLPTLVTEAHAAARGVYLAVIDHRHALDIAEIEALDPHLERMLDSINIARNHLRNRRTDIAAAAKRSRAEKGGKS